MVNWKADFDKLFYFQNSDFFLRHFFIPTLWKLTDISNLFSVIIGPKSIIWHFCHHSTKNPEYSTDNLAFLPVSQFLIIHIIKQLLVRNCWWLSVSVCNWNFKHFYPMNSSLIESKWNSGVQSDSVFASIPLKPNVDMNRFNARGSRFDFSILTKEVHLAAKRNILASIIFPNLSRF